MVAERHWLRRWTCVYPGIGIAGVLLREVAEDHDEALDVSIASSQASRTSIR